MLLQNSEAMVVGQNTLELLSDVYHWDLSGWEQLPELQANDQEGNTWEKLLSVDIRTEVYTVHGTGYYNFVGIVYDGGTGVVQLKFRDPESTKNISIPMKISKDIAPSWGSEITFARDLDSDTLVYRIRITDVSGNTEWLNRYVIFRNFD